LFKGVKKSAPYWFRGDHYITPWTPVKSNSKTKTSSIVVFKFIVLGYEHETLNLFEIPFLGVHVA
jgi:hypothetical protein